MISPRRPPVRRRPYQHLDALPQGSFGGLACLLVGLLGMLLLTSCGSGSTAAARATPTALPSATPIATIELSPVLEPLAPPPTNCAIVLPPQQLTVAQLGLNANAQLVGGGPFWIYGAYYQSILHVGQLGDRPQSPVAALERQVAQAQVGRSSGLALAYPGRRPVKGWPIAKIVAEVGPNYTQPVTLRLRNLQTGALAWWTDGQTPPRAATQTLVLDPLADTESVGAVPGVPDVPHGEVAAGWREWGIFPLFQVAGCYALEVSWSGGSWRSVFAAGS